MAKKSTHNSELEGKETVEVFRDLDQGALKTEKFLERNAKLLSIIFGGLLLAVLGYFAYQQFVIEPKNEDATKAYLAAFKNMEAGKDDQALGGKSAANPGFMGTAKEYGSTSAGKLAAYNAALLKYKQGKYQEAYNLMDQFSSDNKTFTALKYGVMADCQANLNKTADAISLLDKAAAASDDPYTIYYFTKKAGLLSLAANQKDAAKKYFTTIDEKYQDYDNGTSDAYIEMVKYF